MILLVPNPFSAQPCFTYRETTLHISASLKRCLWTKWISVWFIIKRIYFSMQSNSFQYENKQKSSFLNVYNFPFVIHDFLKQLYNVLNENRNWFDSIQTENCTITITIFLFDNWNCMFRRERWWLFYYFQFVWHWTKFLCSENKITNKSSFMLTSDIYHLNVERKTYRINFMKLLLNTTFNTIVLNVLPQKMYLFLILF